MPDHTETGAVPPALTEEQWASVREEAREPADLPREEGPLTGVTISYTHGRLPTGSLVNPFDPAALIALLNAARDDADPGKLTRDDVELLREAINAARVSGNLRIGPGNDAAWDRHQARVARWDRALAKLAALLPPEGT